MTSTPGQGTVRAFVFAAIAAIAAGLAVAGLLLWATSRGGGVPSGPFSLGSAEGIQENVRDEGPVYVADPTGGGGLWLDLEGDDLVALVAVPPAGPQNCAVRWRDSIGSYSDCDGARFDSDELDRYVVRRRDGLLIVDTSRTIAPEAGSG
ncbi:MAG TPA: hypothetical protein VFF40_06655 [Acidimicrobiia bacterium]|nr:hypothetical protein [Acidimicrobiia bacterium]